MVEGGKPGIAQHPSYRQLYTPTESSKVIPYLLKQHTKFKCKVTSFTASVQTGNVHGHGIYFRAKNAAQVMLLHLERLNLRHKAVVLRDFNAPSSSWGYQYMNSRGTCLADGTQQKDLSLLSNPAVETFRRGQTESLLDLGFGNPNVGVHHVTTIFTGSEHAQIDMRFESHLEK